MHVLSRISRPHRISTWLLTVWTVVFGAWIVGAIVEGAPGSVDSGIGVSVLISLFFAGITMIGLVALITRGR